MRALLAVVLVVASAGAALGQADPGAVGYGVGIAGTLVGVGVVLAVLAWLALGRGAFAPSRE